MFYVQIKQGNGWVFASDHGFESLEKATESACGRKSKGYGKHRVVTLPSRKVVFTTK